MTDASERGRRFPDIDDVVPLSSDDAACLQEIRDVLAKHGALQRFGVTLLHDHFSIADDEVLIETCDTDERTLITRPMKRSQLHDWTLVETNWTLGTMQPVSSCRAACKQESGGRHILHHNVY